MTEPTPEKNLRLPWERQKGESEKQYAHFVVYRDAGRGRTVAKVADDLKRSRGYLFQVCRDKGWVRRAEAWDRELDQAFSVQMAERRKAMVEQTLALIGVARNKLVERIRGLDAAELTPGDWIRWFEVLLKAEKEAVGLPSQVVGVSGPEGGPIEAEITALSDDQRGVYLRRLATEALRRSGVTPIEGEMFDDDADLPSDELAGPAPEPDPVRSAAYSPGPDDVTGAAPVGRSGDQ